MALEMVSKYNDQGHMQKTVDILANIPKDTVFCFLQDIGCLVVDHVVVDLVEIIVTKFVQSRKFICFKSYE